MGFEMNRIKIGYSLVYIIGGALLASGFFFEDFWAISILIVSYRLLLLIGYLLEIKWLATIVFILDFIVLIAGVFLNVLIFTLVLGLVFSLASWDLAGYRDRFIGLSFHGAENESANRHLRQLAITCLCGVSLAVLPLSLKFTPGFGYLILFSIVSVIGVVLGIQLARRST